MELRRVTKRFFANPFLNDPSTGASIVTKEWLNEQAELLVHKVTRRKYNDEEIDECTSSNFITRSIKKFTYWVYNALVVRIFRRKILIFFVLVLNKHYPQVEINDK